MKRLHILLILVSLLMFCTLVFSSCQDNSLSKPSGLNLDVATQTLRWNAVKGAKYYTVTISGQEKDITTKQTSISLEKLDPGEYEIKVQANSDSEVYKDSAYATFHFKREVESGLKYQLINNDTEFELVGGGSASGDVVMESVYRGKPVTSIADKALYGNIKITNFTVGENVKKIGAKAFAKCSKLETVVIPDNVSAIGELAFQSCKALTSVTLSDNITTIPSQLFDWCSALTTLKIGKSITSIGEYAFANCEELVTITYEGADHTEYAACLPITLQTISDYAFTDCYKLTTLRLGGVQVIGASAFNKCKALTKVDLGTSLESLQTMAFASCVSLNGVRVPDATKQIADGAFINCSALDDISFGSGIRSVGSSVFVGTKLLDEADEMLVVDGWLIAYTNQTAESLTIKEGIHGIASFALAQHPKLIQANLKGVKYVGYAAFYQSASLYKITFDDALVEVGEYAFAACPFLANVSLGNSLSSIGSYAFYGCEDLETITLPSSLSSIGTRAFRKTAAYNTLEKGSKGILYMGNWAVDYVTTQISGGVAMNSAIIAEGTRGIANYTFNKATLMAAVIPDSVEYIGRGAFYNCPMYIANLPANLKSIGDYAFYGCGYVNFGGKYYDLVIPDGTESIGRSAFYNCSNILSIEIPGSVKTIGPYAFYGSQAVGLTVDFKESTGETDTDGNPITTIVSVTGYIKLGEGIEYIGDRAFQGCVSLREIVIPDSVTYLGTRAFYKCQSLTSVTIGSGITNISEYLFYKCEALKNVVVSDDLESIGNYAFRGCISLCDFDFKSVKNIGRYAFYGCSSFTKIVLPDTIVSIGDYAFRGCNNATAVIIPESLETIGKHVFYGLNSTTLYCEADAIKPYWNIQFNSSFRPTFWGCTLSEDGKYVVSIVAGEDSIVNSKAKNGISDPICEGSTFVGWTTEQGATTATYTSENVDTAPAGTILYAVYAPEATN
ncbi:MAG: leucine-rich repeat domain-containing protein [Clostridia bacterium]|nr:leucine-rich repeat domain-containing protein [Clostridia bacterium]